MQILIVSTNYHPALGGVETQIRMVANELSRRHRVEVATSRLQVGFPSAKIIMERIGIRKPLERLKIWNLLRKLNSSLFLPRFKNYVDGEVPVNVISPTGFDRIRMLPVVN